MNRFQQAPARTPYPTISSTAEAQKLANHLGDAMSALIAIVERETAFVRAGKVREAIALDEQKSELSRKYVTAIGCLKANQRFMSQTTPQLLAKLHQAHDQFRAVLQINLTVLATAHAVSEGIVRGVQGEMQKRAVPSTYNASGYSNAPGPRQAAPLAVSRSL